MWMMQTEMITDRQSRALNNIVSPYGLAIISYAFFLFACLIPPSVYSHYMNEPDLMFLDPATILFYSLCVAAFLSGVWLIGWLFPTTFVLIRFKTKIAPVLFLFVPLALGIGAVAVAMFLLLKQVPGISLLLLSQQGADVKDALAFDVQGRFTAPPLMLTGIIWWAYWRHSSISLSTAGRRLVNVMLAVAIVSVVLSSTLLLSRNHLMQLLTGMAILYVLRKIISKQMRLRLLLKIGATVSITVASLFMAFSFLRGTNSLDDQLHGLLGYTIASYNRLAALVNGDLHYPLAGHGIYLSAVATHTRLLPFKSLLHTPETVEAWAAEFGAVSEAGLDGSLIWSGTFGYIFSDLGWFSVFFVFGYGLMYGLVWKLFKAGNVFGCILYPCFGFCILFWLGTNYLLDEPLELLLLASILLLSYETLFRKPVSAYIV